MIRYVIYDIKSILSERKRDIAYMIRINNEIEVLPEEIDVD